MALLSNGASSMQITTQPNNGGGPNGGPDGSGDFNSNDRRLLSSLFTTLPCWDAPPHKTSSGPVMVPQSNHNNSLDRDSISITEDILYSNVLGAIGSGSSTGGGGGSVPGAVGSGIGIIGFSNGSNGSNAGMSGGGMLGASDIYGAIGTGATSQHMMTPSTSPQTNSSSSNGSHCPSSVGAICGRCDTHASSRCLDCNDVLCEDCTLLHGKNAFTKEHLVIPINTISPIGSAASCLVGNGIAGNSGASVGGVCGGGGGGGGGGGSVGGVLSEPHCDVHGEVLRYLCESCKKVVCQECTLWDHKDHSCIPVANVSHGAPEKIMSILESGKLGTKYIKASIDRAVTYSQAVERDAIEASARIRKAMRHFILAAEDRERTLLERVDKFRQQKLTSLSDQMAGLRAALAGLSQTADMMTKALDLVPVMSSMEIAQTLTTGESQMEKFAAMYKNLQPKEEFITFVAPNFELLQEIRMQGDVMLVGQRSNSVSSNGSGSVSLTGSNCGGGSGGMGSSNGGPGGCSGASGNILTRRPIVRSTTPAQRIGSSSWDSMGGKSGGPSGSSSMCVALGSSPTSFGLGPVPGAPILGQCIPGCSSHVSTKPAIGPSLTFGFDGHEDGQVSRPWGITVDKDGHILVADRRNNRVQIFYPDGAFKLKFGSKGTANGQFDLPAGICTDGQGRIIVVDKDNHRVQVFTATGTFLHKFGSYGKECGQFQYPWDVAVNTKGEILVTDSRNHRIQLFSPDGLFISRYSFDGVNHSRYLKGLTTPRGACFTPQGDIIISDFENHRLLLIDSTLSKVLAAKGHEGSAIHEFSRPSGICCDDDGRVIVADSKNQRVLIFTPQLEFLWAVEIRPSSNGLLSVGIDEKDRPSDVALLPDGRLVVMVETSPDARDQCSPQKTFVQIY
ncbi:protein wech [Anopheles ziemanni]|uniref:protein wech n=1 Tax=Anopheles coustani TaxID=139045 RepID=UPI002657BEF3|nr:protein wech [Anopheles coustani]XP_058122567.1 protein wech [Anopheles coustani]XP_058167949.1 protein wech [Anopheles ziemanni]XP_058167950.1 protein wech [Anopheles ziemanni]